MYAYKNGVQSLEAYDTFLDTLWPFVCKIKRLQIYVPCVLTNHVSRIFFLFNVSITQLHAL